jgi:adenylylsulfate kinase-like enzyme
MFQNQTVENITSTAASAKNIEDTCKSIFDIIEDAKANQKKAICFVTGVPGAGKTLVGLRVAG